MTYQVDCEQSKISGDFRYTVGRLDRRIYVTRELLNGAKSDPAQASEEARPEDLPADLKRYYNTLAAGELPTVA